jgi:SMI1 / KNR4 family (SUKH-1)
MDPLLWNQVFSRLDPADRRLRQGLSFTGIARLETSLGVRLPEGYRTFLQAHDGGWIGDQKIYGSAEIRHLLELGRERFQRDPSGTTWKGFESPYRRLLPIHPASSQSVECLSLDAGCDDEAEPAIYWVRFPRAPDPGRIEGIIGVRNIDVDVLTWSQPAGSQSTPGPAGDPEIEATYVDFLDWALDAVLEAEARHGLQASNTVELGFR